MTNIILFLDIDGVLITTKPWQQDKIAEDGYSCFDNECASNLNILLASIPLDIILTSSRRKTIPLDIFNQFFRNRNIKNQIVNYLPIISSVFSRKQEIEDYIFRNNIQNFIIIDDDKSLNNLNPILKKNLVLTNSMIGFSKDKLEESLEIVKNLVKF